MTLEKLCIHHRPRLRPIFICLILSLALIFFTFGRETAVFAAPDDKLAQNMVSDLGKTLEDSLEAEQGNLKTYKERLARVQREQIYLAAAANGFQLQLSTYGNLLLSTGVDISSLNKTRAGLKSSMIEIQKMIDEIAPLSAALSLEQKHLEQQKQLVVKQISEMSKIKATDKKNELTRGLEKLARQLAVVLKDKESFVSKLDEIYQKRLAKLSETQKAFSALALQFDAAIEQRKTKKLFERKREMFRLNAITVLKEESSILFRRAGLIGQPDFWINGGQKLWESAGLLAVSFLVVLAGVLIVLLRIRTAMSGVKSLPVVEQLGHWHTMTAALLTLSVVPGGAALTVYSYSRLDAMYLVAPALKVAAFLMLIYLAFRWVGTLLAEVGHESLKTRVRPVERLRRGAAIFTLFYLILHYTLGQESGLLVVYRMAGSFCLLVWALFTWRDTRFARLQTPKDPQDRKQEGLSLGSKYLLVMLSGVSLVFDMVGYGSLSVYWIMSWTQSMLIVFWWTILFLLIQEWDQYYRKKSHAEREEFLYDDYPIQWVMIRAGQFIWLVSLAALLILAWGNQQTVLGRVYQILAHPLTIGNMAFSLMGVIYAVLVLLITYALTRMWKWGFQYKFLSKSGMALGLQDSITTITIYVIWVFGLLISLHVFGLNTASLAVAFGALGIGLGFGLQNIFNNFISGIILLFERPIQVGDDVEINGTWAQVKNINVRSTVVQTYDNASLIIPNADFISNQVTNWSFKDKRIRRGIDVGVAYGSDVELVRETLLEIARTTAKVLGRPKSDVLFKDFGDSALVFKLRIWTDIDNMLRVETDIRFKIDRLFKERNIEISFPQRDIHIRSVVSPVETMPPKVQTPDSNVSDPDH